MIMKSPKASSFSVTSSKIAREHEVSTSFHSELSNIRSLGLSLFLGIKDIACLNLLNNNAEKLHLELQKSMLKILFHVDSIDGSCEA